MQEDELNDILDLGRAPSADALLSRFEAILSRIGASDFSIASARSPTRIDVHHATPGTRAWQVASMETGLVEHCPSVAHAQNKDYALTVESIQEGPHSRAARDAVNLARECGVRHGLVVPVHLTSGSRGGVAILAPRALRPPVLPMLTAASIVMHGRFEALLGRTDHMAALTARERDVLAWMAEGKQAEDVAALLGISASTVMFHSRQAQEKLRTSNRTHTVAEAIRRGFLH